MPKPRIQRARSSRHGHTLRRAEPHRDIAANPGRILHVLAGPGTGKAFAMMRRIARLLQGGVVPRRILAVTFTRTAARELREQLARLNVPGSDDVRATTLHSLCFSILSSQEAFAFNQRTPRLLMSRLHGRNSSKH